MMDNSVFILCKQSNVMIERLHICTWDIDDKQFFTEYGFEIARGELKKLNIRDIIINSIIGHSNEDVGDDVYTHVSIEEKIEALKLVKYDNYNNLILFEKRA